MNELIVITICLLLNALLSAYEMAFISVGKPELRQLAKKGDLAARKLLALRENPERTLSVLQIGITLVGAISAAVGGAGAEESLAPLIRSYFNVSEETSEALAIGAVVIPLTYFSVVLGELIPKTIAIRQPRKIAIRGAGVIALADRVFHPVVSLLENSTQLIIALFPSLKSTPPTEDKSIHLDDLSGPQQEYVTNVLKSEKLRIKEIMIPWAQVDTIYDDLQSPEVLTIVAECGHTRSPVINRQNQVIGILNSKEFLAMTLAGKFEWQFLIREPIRVKAEDEIIKTLKFLQATSRHLATVIENDQPIGIVTLEDIVEEIIGDVRDEDDDGFAKSILASRARRVNKI